MVVDLSNAGLSATARVAAGGRTILRSDGLATGIAGRLASRSEAATIIGFQLRSAARNETRFLSSSGLTRLALSINCGNDSPEGGSIVMIPDAQNSFLPTESVCASS